MRRVSTDAIVEESNLSQQIFTLRRMLGEDPKDHRYIQTVPRRGYRFVASVTSIGVTSEAAPVIATVLRLSLVLPSEQALAIGACSPIALSPDGHTLAYVALEPGGTALFLGAMDRDTSLRPIASSQKSTTAGNPVRYVGSTFVPGEARCMCACSRRAVPPRYVT
jgi:hypothetical protein